MAATIKWFGKAQGHLANGVIDWDTNTFKVSLHTSSYTPDQDTHDYFDDCTDELAASGNYSSGGNALTNCTSTYTAATNVQKLDADDLTFTALTPSAAFRYGVIRKARGGAASADELVAYIDFGANQDPAGSDFTITWNTAGILTMTAA